MLSMYMKLYIYIGICCRHNLLQYTTIYITLVTLHVTPHTEPLYETLTS